MKKHIKIISICSYVTIVAICLVVVLIKILPFMVGVLAVVTEDKRIEKHLDNEYINSNYSGWTDVNVDNMHSFKIPSTWTVEQKGRITEFKSVNNEMLAYCGTVKSYVPTDQGENQELPPMYENTASFISAAIGTDVETIEYEVIPGTIVMGASDFQNVTVICGDTSYKYCLVTLLRSKTSCAIIFPLNESLCAEEVVSLCEAIVYSYVYL